MSTARLVVSRLAFAACALLAGPPVAQAQIDAEARGPGSRAQLPDVELPPPAPQLVRLASDDEREFRVLDVAFEQATAPSLCRRASGQWWLVFEALELPAPLEAPPEAEEPDPKQPVVEPPVDVWDGQYGLRLSVSDDSGETWGDSRPIEIEGLAGHFSQPTDGHLIELQDGTLRLYFSSRPDREFATGAFAPAGRMAVFSARSTDGGRWTLEPEHRFAVEGSNVEAPCLVQHGGTWHFYAPIEGRIGAAYHAVSAGGLRFQRLPDIELKGATRWAGCALSQGGFVRFFGSGRVGWSARSRDGSSFELLPRTRFGSGSDPAVLESSVELVMIATNLALPDLNGDEDELDPDLAELGAALSAMGGGATMAANDRYLYLLRGERLLMFDATTLRYIRSVKLPKLPR